MRPKNYPAAWREENERGARDVGQVARLSRQRGVGISQPSLAAHPRTGHHPEYPLERICTHGYEPFQLKFARHAEQLLSGQEDVQSEPSHRGLIVRAETEPVLSNAVEVLLDFYGPQIQVGPPTIRYHEGTALEEPWMGIEVRCAPRFLESVKADLAMRRARVFSSELHSTGTVIQATAPLAQVIGYAPALAGLTSGTASEVMWLSHYAPTEDPPPRGDAASGPRWEKRSQMLACGPAVPRETR